MKFVSNTYSLCTESTYISWIKRFIIFNNERHPTEMGAAEVGMRIPVQPGHAFHGKLDSHSRANWTLIPRQTGQ